MIPFREFVDSMPLLLLDGATGTELSRRGVDLSGPSWTAAAILERPRTLFEIHRDYVDAGAMIVTANTFRTHSRNLECLGLEKDAATLTREAVRIAREAADGRAYVAGSIAPIGDCYSPDQTPPGEELLDEHRVHVANLVSADVDLLLIETQITVAEAVAATQASTETGIPVIVSFYCRSDGQLLSGESLQVAVEAIGKFSPLGISVNCVPAPEVSPLLPILANPPTPMMIGAYANTGKPLQDGTWKETSAVDPANYAELASAWSKAGTRFIGGCCGTTPQHISTLKKRLYGNSETT